MTRMPIVYSDRPRLVELANNLYRLDLPMPEAIGPSNSYILKRRAKTGWCAPLLSIQDAMNLKPLKRMIMPCLNWKFPGIRLMFSSLTFTGITARAFPKFGDLK